MASLPERSRGQFNEVMAEIDQVSAKNKYSSHCFPRDQLRQQNQGHKTLTAKDCLHQCFAKQDGDGEIEFPEFDAVVGKWIRNKLVSGLEAALVREPLPSPQKKKPKRAVVEQSDARYEDAVAHRDEALQRQAWGAENVFLSAFPMFVPSLSWQNDRFYI
jgi:hypothetical protein